LPAGLGPAASGPAAMIGRGSTATVSNKVTVAARAGPNMWQVEHPANNAIDPCVNAIGRPSCTANGCEKPTVPGEFNRGRGLEANGGKRIGRRPDGQSKPRTFGLKFVGKRGVYCRKIFFIAGRNGRNTVVQGVSFRSTCIILLFQNATGELEPLGLH
jgi:hypothetical protein